MKALLAQLACRIGDIEGNVARVVEALESHPEADLAVFPELYVPGYTYRDLDTLALPLDSPEIAEVARAAARVKTGVIVGFAERVTGGVRNAVAAIDTDGRIAGSYAKAYLYPPELKAGFLPGQEFLIFELAGRRVAPLICYDIEFPEPGRQVMQAGAEILATASGNMEPLYIDHAIGVVARAHENRLPHLYANLTGAGDGLVFVGGSRCVAPTGEIVAEAGRDQEELLVVTVPEPGGYDENTHYPNFIRPPLPVSIVPKWRRTPFPS